MIDLTNVRDLPPFTRRQVARILGIDAYLLGGDDPPVWQRVRDRCWRPIDGTDATLVSSHPTLDTLGRDA